MAMLGPLGRRGGRWLSGLPAVVLLVVAVCLVRGMPDGPPVAGDSVAGGAKTRGQATEGSPAEEGREPAGEATPDAETAGEADEASAKSKLEEAVAGLDGLFDGGFGTEDLEASIPAELSGLPVSREETVVALGVPESAGEALERYRQRGDASLAHAGWLDLQGKGWGCVVTGGDWVEVCLVAWRSEGESAITKMRMEVGEWDRAYGASQDDG